MANITEEGRLQLRKHTVYTDLEDAAREEKRKSDRSESVNRMFDFFVRVTTHVEEQPNDQQLGKVIRRFVNIFENEGKYKG